MDKYKTQVTIEDFVVLTTTATLHNLFSYEKGADAVALYLFYYYTAKWQKTNQIKATTEYAMKALNWGRDRFSRAKKILTETGLIEDITKKDKDGKIIGWFIKINFIWSTEKGERVVRSLLDKTTLRKTHRVEKPQTNALSNNNKNALSKDILSIFEFWNEQGIIKHRKLTEKIKTKIRSALREYSLDEIREAISKYAKVLKGDEYFWTYKWTLPDFLARGLTRFLDTPIEEFEKIKNGFGEKKKKPFYNGNPMRYVEAEGKWYVIIGGEWIEFNGKESDIEWKET